MKQTLILPPRYTPDSISLWGAANTRGWQVERLLSWRTPEYLRECEIAIYGEPLFAAVVAQDLEIALLEPPFNWLAVLPRNYSQREIAFTDLATARKQTERAFIKPTDDKSFSAKVYDSSKDLPEEDVLTGETPVLVAEPVNWKLEFRCFVLERKVKTLSPYWRDGELAQDEDGNWSASKEEFEGAWEFSEKLLSDSSIELPPSVVLDIGLIEKKGWAVVEVNPSWASGIYGCEPNAVLDVIAEACVKTERLNECDKHWIIKRKEETKS